MPDQYTKSKTTSYGGRVFQSFKNVLTGFLLFIASFFVLYWGEGLVDVSKIADDAVEVSSESVDATQNENLVYTRGEITSSEDVGGDTFLKSGDYIRVVRNTEVYAWVEKTDSNTTRNSDGSETTETTYTYTKEWVDSAQDSSTFDTSEGHINKPKTIENKSFNASDASVGVYELNLPSLHIRYSVPLILKPEMLDLDKKTKHINETYLYIGEKTITEPEVGDMRVHYTHVPDGVEFTVFGDLSGNRIDAHIGKKNTKLYDAFTEGRSEAIAILHKEFQIKTWAFRIIGFFLMWAGLKAMLGPIAIVADRFKYLGIVARGGTGIISFVLALALSLITILISTIFHNIWLLIAVIAALGYYFGVYIKKGK